MSKPLIDNIKEIFNLIYPVGSIYLSVKNTNPGTLFGGTWNSWGAGRVPVGVNPSDTSFNTVEKTGGEKAHTLSVNEIPAHNHSFSYNGSTKQVMVDTGISDTNWGVHWETQSGYRCNATNMNNTGGNGEHNNLQPYITCYMWKRIA